MNESSPKQQILDKIKSTSNVLVTVSNSPSVDALSAALGLTLILNKLDKHTVAIVSGTIPPAIMFLEPNKTFEGTVDSLRDFIIALDKEKADKLRYGIEGNVVKIYITPYRTTLSEADLNFTQGDYNVDLVFAIGVDEQDHLDASLAAHGRILHDASVVTIQNTSPSHISGIDWTESSSSSLCEMIVELADALSIDKPILDKQIATALLTGIVAETERFSNLKTTSQSMTLAAKLMAAGADQQLVAARLQDGHAIGNPSSNQPLANQNIQAQNTPIKQQIQNGTIRTDGGLVISHASTATLEEISNQVKVQSQNVAAEFAEQQLSRELQNINTPKVEALDPGLKNDLENMNQSKTEIKLDDSSVKPDISEPILGGTLSATAEQASRESATAINEDKNKILLNHSLNQDKSSTTSPLNSSMAPEPSEPHIDIFSGNVGQMDSPPELKGSANANLAHPKPSQTEPAGYSQSDHADALAEVHAVFNNPNPEPTIQSAPTSPIAPPIQQTPGLTMPPPLPDFSSMPPPPPSPFNFGQAPQTPNGPQSSDPSQFRIPGQ